MTKNEFARYMSKNNEGMTIKEATEIIEKFLDGMIDAFEDGHSVRFLGFGNFEIVERKEHEGRNPRTGGKIIIPAKRTVKFKSGKIIKEALGCPEE